MPAPLTWLVCLLLAEIMAAAIAVAGGISLWLTGWAVPLAGWLALKALDVGMKPSSYRRHESRREERDREDLLLRAAEFPLYVVPPEAWAGDVSLGGSGSSGTAITHVDFLYVDDALRRGDGRGYLIVNHEPREFREFSLPLFDEEAQGDDVVNLASRFTDIRTNAITGPTAGPRRVMNGVEVVVAGAPKRVERVGFLEHPDLFLYHVPLEDVEVLLLGWRMTDDELRTVAHRLEPMEEGSDLFRRMQAADRATRDRFREEHDRIGNGSRQM
jgi:hypothetical protein